MHEDRIGHNSAGHISHLGAIPRWCPIESQNYKSSSKEFFT